MFIRLLALLWSISITDGKHFDGGTITWAPIDPYDNSSSVDITITQSYSWTYPYVTCATNVPISTSRFSSSNSDLTCVVDCSTDGGYSTKPISILTDCTSFSTSLGMMSSQRSNNISLTAGSYFYLAYVGSAWVGLDYPTQSGLEWSIVTFIDLRLRPDGFINTPPTASVVSPQYAFVNQTIQINVPVLDVNAGDDVRCRWSTYTPGNRRRRRSNEDERINHHSTVQFFRKIAEDGEIIHIRKKRYCYCYVLCSYSCDCSCSVCAGTNCGTGTCGSYTGCTSTSAATIASTTTIETTTTEIQGTLKSTSSYAHVQALDECGGICYPSSVPNGTTLSNCTITFTGLTAGTWYAVALQVEDFINSTSTTPMSSVPVQFLIYVLPQPSCSSAPIILPVSGCLEVQVGVSVSFNLSAENLCNPSVATLADIVVSSGITGMTKGNLISWLSNSSFSYVTFTWTPQPNQVGLQQLCTIAYTSEKLQSNEYCVTFTVKNSSDVCVTTTTTSTTTTPTTSTSTTTSTSSSSTSSTSSTSTSSTTTSTTSTSTTTTTSSTSTSSTSTSTTSTSTTTTTSSSSTSSTSSTSTTSTTTSTTTSSTSTTSTSTSTTSTTTSTTTSSTSTTSTSTTTTTATTTTVTTATTTTATTTKASKPSINWLLIMGLSLLALLLALCCICCCLYRFFWSPAARRHRRKEREVDVGEQTFQRRAIIDKARKTRPSRLFRTSTANKNYNVYDVLHATNSVESTFPSGSHIKLLDVSSSGTMDNSLDIKQNRVTSKVSVRRIKFIKSEKANETAVRIESSNNRDDNRIASNIPRSEISSVRVNKVSKQDRIDDDQTRNSKKSHQESPNASASTRSKTDRVDVRILSRNKTAATQPDLASNVGSEKIMNIEKLTLEMQPIRSHSQTVPHTTVTKTKTSNGVTVKASKGGYC